MIRNVALCYSDSPEWPKMRWMQDAFTALGLGTRCVRTVDELKQADEECGLVVFQNKSGCIRWPNLQPVAERHKSRWAQVWCDLIAEDAMHPLEQQRWFAKFSPIMRAMNLVTVKELDLLPQYRALGVNAHYLDQGAPPCAEIDRTQAPEWDVLFWGNSGPEYQTRYSDIRLLAKGGFRVAWATGGAGVPEGVQRLEWTHPDNLPALASRASCVLSVDVRHDVTAYWSDRLWMALGMGCAVVRRDTPGLPAGPYWTYRNHSELIDAVTAIVCNPAAAHRKGQEARQWAQTNHSVANRCKALLEMAGQLAPSATAAVACL